MFLGRDGFYWWIGVVEDIEDPLILGRAKVRIFGYHAPAKGFEASDINNSIPVSDLPWALVVLPPNSVGNFSRLRLGEWVLGFFLDGPEAQEPAILGYLPTALTEGAISNLESFGKNITTKRTFSELITSNTPLDTNSDLYKKASNRKSFFSESGHSLQFFDPPNTNIIELRHANQTTVFRMIDGDAVLESNNGTFVLGGLLRDLQNGVKNAATKLELEANKVQNYTITYGNTQYTQFVIERIFAGYTYEYDGEGAAIAAVPVYSEDPTNFTNIVGSWSDTRNWFDVYPPAGKTIYDLAGFLPSIAVIHFAGNVDGNDSLRCTWTILNSNRIRVFVQNTEQRSAPAANWIAFWR